MTTTPKPPRAGERKPTPYELWKQSGEDDEKYGELLVKHGYATRRQPPRAGEDARGRTLIQVDAGDVSLVADLARAANLAIDLAEKHESAVFLDFAARLRQHRDRLARLFEHTDRAEQITGPTLVRELLNHINGGGPSSGEGGSHG